MNRDIDTTLSDVARAVLLAVCALTAGAAAAALPLRTIEECIETGTRSVSLPGAAGGSVSATPCAGCPSLRLRFDAKTRFQVGKQAVNYAKFRQAATKSDLQLDVFYDPKTRTVTRLRIPAVAPVK